jgi:hypothetical protein
MASTAGSPAPAATWPHSRPGSPPYGPFRPTPYEWAERAGFSAPARHGLRAFEVDRPSRGPLLVVWDHRDPFDGEDQPPADVTWPWPTPSATVTDVFGRTWTARCQHGQIHLPVSVTPLFIEA